MRPSEQHSRLIAGALRFDECDTAVQSWVRLDIYKRASRILALDSKDKRRDAIEIEPETIREAVRAEVLRIFRLRQGGHRAA